MKKVPTLQAWLHRACAACQKPAMEEETQVGPGNLTRVCTALGRSAVEKEVTAYSAWNLRSWASLVRAFTEGGASSLSWLLRACAVLGRQAAEGGEHFPGLVDPEEASYGREGAALMSLQAVGRLVV